MRSRTTTVRRCSPATSSSRARSVAPTCRAATTRACSSRSASCSTPIRTTRSSTRATWASRRSGRSARATRSSKRSPGSLRPAMSAKLQAPRGTYDVLPDDAFRRDAVVDAAGRILGAAGYRRIETPAFEATELFSRGVGSSTDIVQKEMYTFEDGGGRSLTLRPEGTAPIARAYLEHGMQKLPQPVKLWYFSSFFRYERAQAGRYRQFWQVGAEAIGSADPAVDAEAIALLHALLSELGVRELHL